MCILPLVNVGAYCTIKIYDLFLSAGAAVLESPSMPLSWAKALEEGMKAIMKYVCTQLIKFMPLMLLLLFLDMEELTSAIELW